MADRAEVGIHQIVALLQHSVETEGSSGELVHDGRIDARIVAIVGANTVTGSQKSGQELLVCDGLDIKLKTRTPQIYLDHSSDNLSGFLEDTILIPARIHYSQRIRDSVVETEEVRMQRMESNEDSRASITGQDVLSSHRNHLTPDVALTDSSLFQR